MFGIFNIFFFFLNILLVVLGFLSHGHLGRYSVDPDDQVWLSEALGQLEASLGESKFFEFSNVL